MTDHQKCQFIISKFCKEKPNWAKEIKIAKKLLISYPDIKFWEQTEEKFLKSLVFFLCEDGSKWLAEQDKKQKLEKQLAPTESKKVVLSDKKFYVSTVVNNKPKTLMDFLKG